MAEKIRTSISRTNPRASKFKTIYVTILFRINLSSIDLSLTRYSYKNTLSKQDILFYKVVRVFL